MPDALRRSLHLDGPLPAGIACEVVCQPTFHPPIGFRLGRNAIEVWAPDDVSRYPFDGEPWIQAATAGATAAVHGTSTGGRDGLAVYVRTGAIDVVRRTTSDAPDDPVLRFAADLLAAIARVSTDPWVRERIAAIRSYWA